MNPETLKALRGSIKKWRAIVAGTEDDFGMSCELCKRFCARWGWICEIPSTGERCPVYERTGVPGCEETPYDQWRVTAIDTPESDDAAKAELAFLISLLPEGEKP